MAIISIMAAMLLGNRNQYSELLILKNETYKAVLFVRQAQVYSLGVKAGGSSSTFNTSYGVYFDTSAVSQFKFFTDENGNGKWDTGEANENVPLQNGVEIQKICLELNQLDKCYPIGTGQVRKAVITFKRPSAEAIVKGLNTADNVIPPLTAPAFIFLKSKTGLISSITVDSTGVIAVVGI